MKKIVINACHGGFGLSRDGVVRYHELQGKQVWPEKDKYGHYHYWLLPPGESRVKDASDSWREMSLEERYDHNRRWSEQVFYDRELARDDPLLVQVVEELGNKANGEYAKLKVVEIPDEVNWEIGEYDGYEHVAEKHRTWD